MATLTDNRTEVEEQVRARQTEFVRNVNAGDAEKLVREFHTENAALLAPNAPLMKGQANIQGLWQALIDAGLTDVATETLEIHSSGDLAYAIGSYTLAIRPQGAEGVQDCGKFVEVYRRQQDGSWKAVVDIFNSDLQAS